MTTQAEIAAELGQLRATLHEVRMEAGEATVLYNPGDEQRKDAMAELHGVEHRIRVLEAQVQPPGGILSPFLGHGPGQVHPWPPGTRVLHVYAVPDLHDPANAAFADLVESHRAAITGRAAHLLTPVPAPWLHMTIAKIVDPGPADTAQVDALAAALHAECAAVGPATVEMRPLVGPLGTLLAPAPWALAELRQAVATAVSARTDPAAWAAPDLLHMSTSYCHTVGHADDLADHLLPDMAPLRVSGLDLVAATQDPSLPGYTWDTLAHLPLTGRPAPGEAEE